MQLIKSYISNFSQRSGGYIFIATIAARILSFISAWLVLQFISKNALGEVLFSWNIIVFIIPFVGFGLHQSYIRYGALLKNSSDKKILLHYILRNGVLASVLLTMVVFLLGAILPFKNDNSGTYLMYLSLLFVPVYQLEVLKIKNRLEHRNKRVGIIEITYNLILVTMVGGLSYFFEEFGYVFALILTPIITVLLFQDSLKIKLKKQRKLEIINKEFWKYGFFGGLSNMASILLFTIDLILVGLLLDSPEKVTIYRYISIIPFSILFLPRVFMTTDFVAFTEKINDRKYIKRYIKSYLYLFTSISILFVLFFYIFDTHILEIFDKEFMVYSKSFLVLNIGVCGVLIFRGLFGNLLSAIGKIKVNYYITIVALVGNIVLNYWLIPKLDILGACLTSAILMWFTGLSSYLCFFYFYFKKNTTA